MRQRKAFTLPKGRVQHDAVAFGRVYADIAYVLRRDAIRNTNGWLPHGNKDNVVTDYLRRVFHLAREDTIALAEQIWSFLTSEVLHRENKGTWKLDHERIFVSTSKSRYVCNRCGLVTAYSVKDCCPRKECEGKLVPRSFDSKQENIIARWVAGTSDRYFSSLKSEEHTAQINKDLARIIEDEFRAEGVNLLSSTTTFEMGINIGDLQKILLRNAPPSSASYVQRVGRAGRGKDKNSVCVTLCRRSKYDADAWKEPPRLMSGEVRTPTVFTENRVIAQRHFNAVVFAKYLRIKVRDEGALGQVRQKIRLEAFLPLEERVKLPPDWRLVRPVELFLDFLSWLDEQQEGNVFQTQAGRSISKAVTEFVNALGTAKAKYAEILVAVSGELSALMDERAKLQKLGRDRDAADIGQAVRNLLDSDVISLLARRGFLPRYAFPLDVVNLETGKTRWSRDTEVELSRDRGLAIAEFAPAAQIIALKKSSQARDFTS
jgi:hypothetical protein